MQLCLQLTENTHPKGSMWAMNPLPENPTSDFHQQLAFALKACSVMNIKKGDNDGQAMYFPPA